MSKGTYKIPFSMIGNQMAYPISQYNPSTECWEIDWRDNYVFEATLTYAGFSRGRSAAGFELVDEEGHLYYLMMSEMDRIMALGGWDGNKITGKWTFVKKGQNYGIMLIKRVER